MISWLLMFSEIVMLLARKNILYLSLGVCAKIAKHTCLDILTPVFGYLITRVWICVKGHPCDKNEATRLVYYVVYY